MNYQTWLDEWLTSYVKPSVKMRTYETYEHLTKHVKSSLGKIPLAEITPITLQRFVLDLIAKGLSSNTVNAIITAIKASLSTATDVGLISVDPSKKMRRPKIDEKAVSCFTVDEQRRIEKYVLSSEKQKEFGILLCLYTGLRIGELLALKWEDIDFLNRIISVTKACYDGKGEDGKFVRITDTPKTKTSKRIIPIPKQMMPLVRKYQSKSKSVYVVSNERGEIPFVRSYQRGFERTLKKLGISRKSFHSLRHTFATRAIECGMDVKTLSEILGHKNPSVTLSRYVHSLIEHKAEMMNLLGTSLLAKGITLKK